LKKRSKFIFTMLAFGYAFLYIPLASVVFFSFNNSSLATVWGGFSTRWYGELLKNDQVLDAALSAASNAISPPLAGAL
jgi:putrescine transport system permease protein